jgi:hypothetical protein
VLKTINRGVTIPNSTSLSQTRIILAAWVYMTLEQGRARHVISKDNYLTGIREYILAVKPDNKVYPFVRLMNMTLHSTSKPVTHC